MRFLNITIENFGVFEKPTHFKLATPKGERGARNIVLVYGENGSGKSTIFRSLGLGLHGKIALGDRITQKEYDAYILNRLHTKNNNVKTQDRATIQIELELTLSGISRIIYIERTWTRTGNAIKENLDVLLDGHKPPVRSEDFQDWLNTLIPYGIIQSVFFDADQLENFADPSKHNEQLRNTLDRLLGLDLISKLQSDLVTFLINDSEGQALKNLKKEYEETEVLLKHLWGKVSAFQDSIKELEKEKTLQEKNLENKKQAFVLMGGNFALRRPQVEKEMADIENQIKKLRGDIKGFCSDLFPLALAPGITGRFLNQLKKERDYKKKRNAKEFLLEKKETLTNRILGSPEWERLGINRETDLSELGFLSEILHEELDLVLEEEPIFHDLSDPDYFCYKDWIKKALSNDAPRLKELCYELQILESRNEMLKAELDEAPEESWAWQQQNEFDKARAGISMIEQNISKIESEIINIKSEIVKTEQKHNGIVNNLGKFFAQQKSTDLAQRAQGTLGTYKDLLRRNKITQLEESFIKTFMGLCRKEHFIKRININPEDFSTTIENPNGRTLTLDQLSAAERQLYAYSLIGGIHEASGLPLPLIIDTPIARFDKIHGGRLIKDFFPKVSNQVILFATDEEKSKFEKYGGFESTAFSYLLTFNEEEGKTHVCLSNEEEQ